MPGEDKNENEPEKEATKFDKEQTKKEQEDTCDIESGESETEDGDKDNSEIGGLDQASFVMIGRSSRFGRAIKINSKFIF